MSPFPSNRYDEAIFAIGIIKNVTGEKRQGVVSTPPGRPRVRISKEGQIFAGHYSAHTGGESKFSIFSNV